MSNERPLIKSGMEFYIPNSFSGDVNKQIKIVVNSISNVKSTTCWGDHEEEIVFYSEFKNDVKRILSPNKRPDGSTYYKEEWIEKSGPMIEKLCSLSKSTFIEYVINKQCV